MDKRIAMLLNGEIKNDYRVIKMIRSLSRNFYIDLYYINGNSSADQLLFKDNVSLFCFEHQLTTKVFLLRHSTFCYEFNYFYTEALKRNVKYDYIWANDLPTLYPAFKLSEKIKSKLIFDAHEIYIETINQFFPRNSSGLKKIIFSSLIFLMRTHGKKIEKKIFPSIDLLITVNESLLEYFKIKYSVNQGIVIMNVPEKNSSLITKSIDYKTLFSWKENAKILIYQGYLNEGRGLSLLPQTMKNLPDEYKLVIVGSGPLKTYLEDTFTKVALNDRVEFIDAVPLQELPKYTQGADAGINLLESFNLSKQLASPNKLFEYIHSGKPVAASDTVENKKVLDKFKIGTLTQNDPERIAQAILQLFSLPSAVLESELSKAKEYYNWEKQEELLLSVII